jgi:transcriptional regulator with XRE-family HTH domain
MTPKLYLDYNEIGQNIRTQRKERKWSQQQLANALGCSNQLVSFFETGVSHPSLETLLRICLRFDITLDKLVKIHYEGESQ